MSQRYGIEGRPYFCVIIKVDEDVTGLSRLEGRGAVSLAFDGVSPRAHARIPFAPSLAAQRRHTR